MATFASQPGHGFFDKIASRAEKVNSLLMVGLDPHSSELGEGNINAAGAKGFCLRIIEATSSVAVAYKPNAAFFEAFGVSGVMRGRAAASVAADWCAVVDVVQGCMFLAVFPCFTSMFHGNTAWWGDSSRMRVA